VLHFDQQSSKKSQRWPFQSRSAPRTRNYLARNEQRRILGMVLMVGLVVLLMGQVGKPERWKWMWGGLPAAAGGPQPHVDNRVKRVGHDVPDAFQIAVAPPVEVPQEKEAVEQQPESGSKSTDKKPTDKVSDKAAQEVPAGSEEKEAVNEPAAKASPAKDASAKENPASDAPAKEASPRKDLPQKEPANVSKTPLRRGKFFPGVDPSLFRETRDDTVYVAASDDEPFYHLCKVLQDADDKSLAEASTGPATFMQLYRQPKEYRGKLVSMRGKMLRAFKLPAAKNDFGITETYQTWFLPEGGHDPIQVYVLALPPDLPILEEGMKVNQQVEFTGFFFKLVAFKAQDAIRKVPLLVARDVTWIKPPPPAPVVEKAPLSSFVLAVVGAAAGSVILVFFVLFRTQRTNRLRPSNAAERIINEHLANLKHAPRNFSVGQETHDEG
jgi:hypothetical protein